MSPSPIRLTRSRDAADASLARAVAGGEADAFARIDDRYRRPLTRYARSILRRSDHDAEDVVQDVLVSAHAALRAGDGPGELRPWLYRLTRNRAIDEIRRARWGDEALEDHADGLHDLSEEPAAVLSRRAAVEDLVASLADLPVRQRAALLAKEVDGLTTEQIAAELGVSVEAAQMLVVRARRTLLKDRDAGERDERRLARRLHGIFAPPAVAFAPLAALIKLVGGGGGKAAIGAVAATAVVAAGGITVVETRTSNAGDPAPFKVVGVFPYVGKNIITGDRLPAGTTMITAKVHIPAGSLEPDERRAVTLRCPAGMRVASFVTPQRPDALPLSYGAWGDVPGGRSMEIVFGRSTLAKAWNVTVGVLCRKPDANGSLAADPRRPKAGEKAAKVCAKSAYLYQAPGHLFIGTVFRHQPVSISRTSKSGKWVYVTSDTDNSGWLDVTKLCSS